MAELVTVQGPDIAPRFELDRPCTILGRQFDANVSLPSKAVSRHHAQITLRDDRYYLEDLNSSNGTYVNGNKLVPRTAMPLNDGDSVQIGPYVFTLNKGQPAAPVADTEPNLIIRETFSALTLAQTLHGPNPAVKLQMVLEIAQHLARTLDLEPLLDKLLEQLLRLWPQADRGMVIFSEADRLVVRAQRARAGQDSTVMPFSRTIVHRALNDGTGILSDDVQRDDRFNASATLTSLNLHSILCVPLITPDGKRLGVIQMDRFRKGTGFTVEDLQVLTTVSLQVAVALENAELHAEVLREQRLHQELALAREIQQGYLPTHLQDFPDADFEVFGRVYPARQVAGDLYDFFRVAGGRMTFFVGDVSGKGMPAALFMVAVRTLCRHLAKQASSPAAMVENLNGELAADNPSGAMFVTLVQGYYEPARGEVLLVSGGHPPPLLRRANGRVETVELPAGRLLGIDMDHSAWQDFRLTLAPGDSLVFYTDGFVEPHEPESRDMFGVERLAEVVASFDPSMTLAECAERAKDAIETFTGSEELQDDATMLILRRKH